jgi:hypothetical protein
MKPSSDEGFIPFCFALLMVCGIHRADRESVKREKSAFIDYSSEFIIALDGDDETKGRS